MIFDVLVLQTCHIMVTVEVEEHVDGVLHVEYPGMFVRQTNSFPQGAMDVILRYISINNTDVYFQADKKIFVIQNFCDKVLPATALFPAENQQGKNVKKYQPHPSSPIFQRSLKKEFVFVDCIHCSTVPKVWVERERKGSNLGGSCS